MLEASFRLCSWVCISLHITWGHNNTNTTHLFQHSMKPSASFWNALGKTYPTVTVSIVFWLGEFINMIVFKSEALVTRGHLPCSSVLKCSLQLQSSRTIPDFVLFMKSPVLLSCWNDGVLFYKKAESLIQAILLHGAKIKIMNAKRNV